MIDTPTFEVNSLPSKPLSILMQIRLRLISTVGTCSTFLSVMGKSCIPSTRRDYVQANMTCVSNCSGQAHHRVTSQYIPLLSLRNRTHNDSQSGTGTAPLRRTYAGG